MDETSAHKYIKSQFMAKNDNIILGIGDDCAALKIDNEKALLTSSDTLVENTHFLVDKAKPSELGQKAISVAVSDIGAMGGIPKFILSTVGVRKDLEENFLKEIIDGIKDSCTEFNVELIGGNLTESQTIFIDIMVIGEVDSSKIIRRSGARPGDKIYLTGNLGDSALGFKLLSSSGKKNNEKGILIKRHTKPSPRLKVGFLLGQKNIPTSMIDVSDGLLLDLSRITEDFGLGAKVGLEKIPLSKEYLDCYKDFSNEKYELAISGGEDYELLFTTPSDKKAEVLEISNITNVKITEIGTVSDSTQIKFIDENGKIKKYNSKGFIHFN